jgi:hypothetical protein
VGAAELENCFQVVVNRLRCGEFSRH